jgi:hypothetical protein
MQFDDERLSLFTPITDRALLKGTTYFELHQGELPRRNACWLEGSLFITDAAFNFFEGCFEKAINGFDYFSFNRVTPMEVEKLDEEVTHFLATLNGMKQRETIFSRNLWDNAFEIWRPVGTDVLQKAVLNCGKAIRDYVSETRRNRVALHVLGL